MNIFLSFFFSILLRQYVLLCGLDNFFFYIIFHTCYGKIVKTFFQCQKPKLFHHLISRLNEICLFIGKCNIEGSCEKILRDNIDGRVSSLISLAFSEFFFVVPNTSDQKKILLITYSDDFNKLHHNRFQPKMFPSFHFVFFFFIQFAFCR